MLSRVTNMATLVKDVDAYGWTKWAALDTNPRFPTVIILDSEFTTVHIPRTQEYSAEVSGFVWGTTVIAVHTFTNIIFSPWLPLGGVCCSHCVLSMKHALISVTVSCFEWQQPYKNWDDVSIDSRPRKRIVQYLTYPGFYNAIFYY